MGVRSLSPARVRLLTHATLVAVGTLSAVGWAPQGHPTSPASSAATTAAASSASRALTAPTGPSAALLSGNPASVMPHPIPPRTTTVSPVPSFSYVPNDEVEALAQDGTYVYLGGAFTSLASPTSGATQTHTRLARVSLATGVPDATWNPTVNGDVTALALDQSQSKLVIGGLFTTVNGTARTNLAEVSTTNGSLVSGFTASTDDQVRALLLDSGQVLVGGDFTHVDGSSATRLARVDEGTGALDPSFSTTIDKPVLSLAAPSGRSFYVIGGSFTTVGGQARSFLAEVSQSSGAVNSWAAGGSCAGTQPCKVISLATDSTRMYAATGGVGGKLVAYDLGTGAVDWTDVADGNVQAVALFRHELFAGGHFNTAFAGVLRKTLAAVDPATGALDLRFDPLAMSTFPGTWALLATPVGVVVGGAQTAIGGTAQARLAIFRASQQVPTPRAPGTHLSHSPLP